MYLRGDMRRMRLSFVVIALSLALIPTTLPAQSGSSAQGCEDLLKLASSMGRGVDSVFVNKEVCDAYRFLLERNGTGTKGTQCYKSQTDRILKLNPHFAVGLAKALAEMERLFGGKNIVQSGFRCDGSNGNHPKGCAADIIWASCLAKTGGNIEQAWRCSSDSFNAPEQKWIDANGKNEQYKIHLRLRFAPEGHHVEPVSINGCVTGATVGSASSPTAGLSDIVRRAFSMPTQQAQPTVSQPALPSQPVSISQNPLGSFNQEPALLSPPTSSINTNTVSSTAADRLEELAFGDQATSTATATSVPLVVSGSDAVMLSGTQQASTTSVTTQGAISPSQTTFTSGDLAWQDDTVSSSPVSGFQAILITLRATLNRIAQYLVPFGMHAHEHESEYDY